MRFIYLSRNQNRFGYNILKKLISNNFYPEYLILPEKKTLRDNFYINKLLKKIYNFLSNYYNIKKVFFLESELLLAERFNIKVLIYRKNLLNNLLKDKKIDLIFIGGGWPFLIRNTKSFKNKTKIINIHPSILPKFKGTSVTRWQRLFVTKETGVTLHHVTDKFDSGEIIYQLKKKISINDTPQEIFQKLVKPAMKIAIKFFQVIKNKKKFKQKVPYNFKTRIYKNWYNSNFYNKVDLKNSIESIACQIISNFQEMNFYKTVKIKINKNLFYVREVMFKKNYFKKKSRQNSNYLEIFKINKNGWYCKKKNSRDIIIIKKIQFTKFYKIRKSINPISIEKIRCGDKIFSCDT